MIKFLTKSICLTGLSQLIAICFCLPYLPKNYCLAQTARKDSVKTYELQEVVVTGARYKSPLEKVPASITIINSNEIKAADDINILPVLSTRVPGLFINSKNTAGYGVGPYAGGQISIRGIGGNPNSNILVLIDGQPQFMGIFGHPIVDALNSSDIQRVEIIRGASSVLYGSNALGGAVNIITKQPRLDKIGLRASANYGAFKTLGLSASAGYMDKLFGFFSSFNNINTDGYRTDAEDGFHTTAGYLKLTFTPRGAFGFYADGDVSNSKFYDPGTIYSPTVNNYYKYLRTRGSLSAENNFKDVQGALRFFYSYGDHNFFNGWHSVDEMKGITFYQNINYYGNNIFTFGVDYKNYGGKGTQPGLPPFVAKGLGNYYTANETAFYGLINYSPVSPVNLEAGVRFTRNSLAGKDVTPDFGITYSLDKATVLKASISKAFRNPTINELYLFPVSNPDLKPEHVWNYEISLDKFFLNDALNINLAAYYDKGDNLIVVTPPFNTNTNSGKFIHKGIELSGKYFVSSSFNLSLDYSFLKTDVPALYAPEHKINLMLNYAYGMFSLIANLEQVSGLYTSLQDLSAENYFTADITVNFAATDFLKLYLKGYNILNKNYQIDFGYPMPGRTIAAGISIDR